MLAVWTAIHTLDSIPNRQPLHLIPKPGTHHYLFQHCNFSSPLDKLSPGALEAIIDTLLCFFSFADFRPTNQIIGQTTHTSRYTYWFLVLLTECSLSNEMLARHSYILCMIADHLSKRKEGDYLFPHGINLCRHHFHFFWNALVALLGWFSSCCELSWWFSRGTLHHSYAKNWRLMKPYGLTLMVHLKVSDPQIPHSRRTPMLPITRWWRTGFLLVLTAGMPHWVREGEASESPYWWDIWSAKIQQL